MPLRQQTHIAMPKTAGSAAGRSLGQMRGGGSRAADADSERHDTTRDTFRSRSLAGQRDSVGISPARFFSHSFKVVNACDINVFALPWLKWQ